MTDSPQEWHYVCFLERRRLLYLVRMNQEYLMNSFGKDGIAIALVGDAARGSDRQRRGPYDLISVYAGDTKLPPPTTKLPNPTRMTIYYWSRVSTGALGVRRSRTYAVGTTPSSV